MLRSLKNLKYSAWRDVRRGCSVVATSDRSDVHLVLPTVISSEFAKKIRPLSVPDLIDKFSRDAPGGQFATVAEYLHSDPRPAAVLVPEEIDLHRIMALDDLNAYMHAKDAFKEPQRKNRVFAHVLVVAGADSILRCPFRQRSEFLYLCDCLRPGAALVLHRNRKRKAGALLFLPEEVDSQLSSIYSHMHHVEDVLPLAMLKKSLLWLLRDQSPELWHSFQTSSPVSRIVQEAADEAKTPLCNPRYILQYTRTVKTSRELCALRRANAIAAGSMAEVIAQHQSSPQELATSFDYKCRLSHAQPDACKVSCGLDGNGLWQMDAGCQYGGYQGGLARCWPISGRFTPPQKMLYGALLDIHRDLCSLIQSAGSEGAVRTPLELHAAYLILLARHLRELRVLPKVDMSPAETVEVARKYNCSPIVISHVGLGKRDTSRRLLDYPFAPGNIVSLRLSISIPDDCCQAYPEFRGILCQLGDTLHIRNDYSLEVLTAVCPSEPQEIEVCLPAVRARSPRSWADRDQVLGATSMTSQAATEESTANC
ncbi:xaa-Pro aminopeptidase 3 [Drosophila subpulchrella]|uniref:xaa-Pro aminopeptidase 3 n=1 Tax=Drosophila subpulchrella TaxID=1486046 RepID=UPI0018A1B292|nr:xaa-Pro aminopeptidase 3 [Drosophila subpulchrella]